MLKTFSIALLASIIVTLLFGYVAHAQIVPAQNQVTTAPYGGVVLSTSSSPTSKLGQLLGSSFGDLLGWNGARWTTFSTSTLFSFPWSVSQGGTGSTTLGGILKGNGTSPLTTAVNGTDYTLIVANTCGANQFFNTVTASGVFSCGTPSGGSAAGVISIAGVATSTISLVTGTSGTDFNIATTSDTITLNLPTASAVNRGALSSADWTNFSNKQPAGNYITALTGDATASGPGSAALTLATVNGNVGSFTCTNLTVNGKGLITAAANGTCGSASSSPFATTTSTVAGQNIVYPLNTTDILVVGGNSTTTAPVYFNPNNNQSLITGVLGLGGALPSATTLLNAATTTTGAGGTSIATLSQTINGSTATAAVLGLSTTCTVNQTVNNTVVANGGPCRNRYIVTNANVGYRVTELSSMSTSYSITGANASTTNAAGLEGLNPNSSAGTVTDNFMSFWVRGGAQTGTITNRYGLRIDALTGGTNRYGVSQEGSGDLNYFAGNTGFGTTTPWKLLSVAGDMVLTGALFDRNATAGTNGQILQTTSTGIQWISTSTLNISATDIKGILLVVNGGTGAASFTAGQLIFGNGTGAFSSVATSTGQCTSASGITCSTFTVVGSVSPTFALSAIPNSSLANSTISGVALGSNLANLTATDSTLTFSGTYNGSAARTIGLNLNNANSWTALQQFTSATSTLFSATTAWLPSLGTPAGAFLAVSPTGQIIATTSPGAATITLSGDVSGSGTTAITTTIGALKVFGSMIANATIDLTTKVTGILPIGNGGTGQSTNTKGDLLVGNGSLWNKLGVGTDGQVLTASSTATNGVVWAAQSSTGGCTSIASGSLSGTNIDITGIPATYGHLQLQLNNWSHDSGPTRTALVRGSTDNGSTFDATAANYIGYYVSGTTITNYTTNAFASMIDRTVQSAATVATTSLQINSYGAGMIPSGIVNSNGLVETYSWSNPNPTLAMNALRILLNGTGNFDGGTYALYGCR